MTSGGHGDDILPVAMVILLEDAGGTTTFLGGRGADICDQCQST